MTGMHRDPLVTADWLQQNRHAPDIRVVDATWVPPFLVGRHSGSELYKRAHIQGAVYFDIDAIASRETDLPHMLPDPVQFSSQVRKLGLGDGNRLVIYDNNNFYASARVWWMFRAMGHEDVLVLDGGLSAWQSIDGAIEDLPPIPVERHFTARKRADLVRDYAQMRHLMETGETAILDARAPGRFTGEQAEPRPDLPSGHIPGSVNLPASDLLTPEGRFKSADALQPLLAPYLDRPVVTSCGSGVSAALIALGLARLGQWEAALYDGSWSDWASRAEAPIQRQT